MNRAFKPRMAGRGRPRNVALQRRGPAAKRNASDDDEPPRRYTPHNVTGHPGKMRLPTALDPNKPAPAPDSREVILVVADDLSVAGWDMAPTPHLDALRVDGAFFRNVRISGSDRLGVCAPSRASLLTGRHAFDAYNFRGGKITVSFSRWVALPERLRTAGYATAMVGKWHADTSTYGHNFEYGRGVLFRPMGTTHWGRARRAGESAAPLPLVDVDPTAKARSKHLKKLGRNAAVLERCGGTAPRDDAACHSSALFAAAGVGVLDGWRAKNTTGFLYVALTAPHDPLEPSAEALVALDAAGFEPRLPATLAERHPFRLQRVASVYNVIGAPPPDAAPSSLENPTEFLVGTRDELLMPFPRTAAALKARIRAYAGLVHGVDACVGRLAAAARPDRILVVTSDHGLALDGRHGLIGKQSLYEHSSRVPLLIHGAGRARRVATLGTPLYLHDVAPTLLALSRSGAPFLDGPGAPRPGARRSAATATAGRDFSPLLRGGAAGAYKPRAYLLSVMTETQRSIYDGERRFKVIAHFNKSRVGERSRGGSLVAVQAFDLRADPEEANDLVAAAFPNVAAGALHYGALLKASADEDPEETSGDAIARLLRRACNLERKLRRASTIPEKAPARACLSDLGVAEPRAAKETRNATIREDAVNPLRAEDEVRHPATGMETRRVRRSGPDNARGDRLRRKHSQGVLRAARSYYRGAISSSSLEHRDASVRASAATLEEEALRGLPWQFRRGKISSPIGGPLSTPVGRRRLR